MLGDKKGRMKDFRKRKIDAVRERLAELRCVFFVGKKEGCGSRRFVLPPYNSVAAVEVSALYQEEFEKGKLTVESSSLNRSGFGQCFIWWLNETEGAGVKDWLAHLVQVDVGLEPLIGTADGIRTLPVTYPIKNGDQVVLEDVSVFLAYLLCCSFQRKMKPDEIWFAREESLLRAKNKLGTLNDVAEKLRGECDIFFLAYSGVMCGTVLGWENAVL